MKRVCAFIVLISLLLTGCRNTGTVTSVREEEYVSDSEWFNVEIFNTHQYENAHGQGAPSSSGDILYAGRDELITYESYQIFAPDEMKVEGDEPDVAVINRYELTEESDDLMPAASIDVASYGLQYISDDFSVFSTIKTMWYLDGTVYFLVTLTDYSDNTYSARFVSIDLESGDITGEYTSDLTDELFGRETSSLAGLHADDDGVTFIVCDYASESDNMAKIIKTDYSFSDISCDDITGTRGYVSCATYLDGSFFLFAYDDENNEVCYKVTDSGEALEEEDLPSGDMKVTQNINGDLYTADITSIRKYDSDTGEYQVILDYNNCNIDLGIAESILPLYSDEDSIVGIAHIGIGSYTICRFTRADSNPNTGKSVIRVAKFGQYVDTNVTRAIYEFNNSSDSVYVVFDDRYLLENYIDEDMRDVSYEQSRSDEYLAAEERARAAVSNKLALDIVSGEGPDILLDSYDMVNLNNDRLLVDLRPLILGSEGFNKDEFFNVVFAGEDALYQLPLALRINALFYDEDYSDYFSGYSISYDAYDEMVKDANNGNDPLSRKYSRTQYFIALFDYYYGDYFNGGRLNIDTDEFRMLAGFVKDKPEKYTDNWDSVMCNYLDRAYLGEMAPGYLPSGLPCANGRGLMLCCDQSVAITASCPRTEELIPLVINILDGSNLNRDRFVEKATEEINAYNEQMAEENAIYGDSGQERSLDTIEIWTAAMDNAEGIISYDPDINIILMEELQPYFAGDKTIDEIIPLIEDRVRTVQSEREL